jgi:hypothetical protein
MAAQVPYPRWATELVPLVDAALDAAEVAGARLVMVDNLYAYGSPGVPMRETTPEAATSRKGALRRDIGERLLAAHRAGRVRVVDRTVQRLLRTGRGRTPSSTRSW